MPQNSPDFGRIINDHHFRRLVTVRDAAVARGAEVCVSRGESASPFPVVLLTPLPLPRHITVVDGACGGPLLCAQIVVGGGSDADSLYIAPTILRNVDGSNPIMEVALLCMCVSCCVSPC